MNTNAKLIQNRWKTKCMLAAAVVLGCCAIGGKLHGGGLLAEPIQASPQQPTSTQDLFDATRHMRVSEVKPGMKGYGLSVFSGTKIERFEVEVIGVASKMNPGQDVVLIRCAGQNLEHTGSIQGMSGSPIYLVGEDGKARMIGAFAYGWPLSKDPIAGVQPIEYMLKIPTENMGQQMGAASAQVKAVAAEGVETSAVAGWRWEDARADVMRVLNRANRAEEEVGLLSAGGAMRRLSTAVMTSGMSSQAVKEAERLLGGYDMVLMRGGGVSGGGGMGGGGVGYKANAVAVAEAGIGAGMEPGGSMTVPVLVGDFNMTALGTITEVIGDRIWGFGHPMMSEGVVELPLGDGYVDMIVPRITSSFKMGGMTKVVGTLAGDETVGVGGKLGKLPPMVPVKVTMVRNDISAADPAGKAGDKGEGGNGGGNAGGREVVYEAQAASHKELTPFMCATAVISALNQYGAPPTYHTLSYELYFDFSNGRKLEVKNISGEGGMMQVLMEIMMPLMSAAGNPFEPVKVTNFSARLELNSGSRSAMIERVWADKPVVKRGQTLRVFVSVRRLLGGREVLSVDVPIPKNMPLGEQTISVGDADMRQMQDMQINPQRYYAENVQQMFDVMQRASAFRRDALYVSMADGKSGVSMGRVSLRAMPGTKRGVLEKSSRVDLSSWDGMHQKTVQTPYVITGGGQLSVMVEK